MSEPTGDQITRWVLTLPAVEKDRVVTTLIVDLEDRTTRVELAHRFRQENSTDSLTAPESRRTVRALHLAAKLRRAEREQVAARQAADARPQRERGKAHA